MENKKKKFGMSEDAYYEMCRYYDKLWEDNKHNYMRPSKAKVKPSQK